MTNTKQQPPRVLVIGSANIDLVARVARCPRPGESTIGRSFDTIPGGKGANQAVASARLGAKTWFAGCVGNDGFGELQRLTLGAEGIDLSYLKTDHGLPTGTAVIMVADEGENSIVVIPSANYGILPVDIEALAPVFEEIDVVLLQLEIPLETVEAALDAANRTHVLSVLDAGPAQKVPACIIEQAGIVSPNETEAEAITGVSVSSVEDARVCAGRLLEQGAKEVVLKLGAKGCLYMGHEEWIHVPGFNVRPVDTVAAGDAFTAALAIAWTRKSRRAALHFANATGALATLKHGAQPSMPSRTEVEAFITERSL